MTIARGYAAASAGSRLTPVHFSRREPGRSEIELQLRFCGLCHTDVHMVNNDLGFSLYPMVPGHEMIGYVSRTGADVKKFKDGDLAAIGCFVDSCRQCGPCRQGLECYCKENPTASFSSSERSGHGITYGGFSSHYVVDERFALNLPMTLDPARAAPLLCAGITTFSPLRKFNIGRNSRVAVVGVGGLGHLALKFARAMDAHVVAITASADKSNDALRQGAHEVVLASDARARSRLAGSLDLVLDTVAASHELDPLISLLGYEGTLCILGMIGKPSSFSSIALCSQRRVVTGSAAGGLAETQAMLDFCGDHRIEADVEILPIASVNEAFERLRQNDVRYRFVLDLEELRRGAV